MQVIVFKIEGQKVVMTPNLDCGLTVEEIAAKDVPTGIEYTIIDSEEIQEDTTEPQIMTPPVNQDLADVWEAIFALSATKEGGE